MDPRRIRLPLDPSPSFSLSSDLSRVHANQIVVRRLRHEMTEDEFVQAVTAAAAEAGLGERGACWDILYFAPGKMSKKRGRVRGGRSIRVFAVRGDAC